LKAVNVLQKEKNNQVHLAAAYRTLAQFADAEYKRVDKYIHSPMFESKRQCMQKAEEAAKTLRIEQSTLRKEQSQSKGEFKIEFYSKFTSMTIALRRIYMGLFPNGLTRSVHRLLVAANVNIEFSWTRVFKVRTLVHWQRVAISCS
jgi:hypothetical protein